MVDNVTEYIIRGSLTPQSVVDILRNLQYRNMKDEPTSYTRNIKITVSVDTPSILIHMPMTALELANTTVDFVVIEGMFLG